MCILRLVHVQSDHACPQVLSRTLEAEQSLLPTTAQQDKEALERQQQRNSVADTLALQFRIEKKAVLAAALEVARRKRNQLKRTTNTS